MVDIIFTLLELQLLDIYTTDERNYSSILVQPVHTVIAPINTHTHTYIYVHTKYFHTVNTLNSSSSA